MNESAFDLKIFEYKNHKLLIKTVLNVTSDQTVTVKFDLIRKLTSNLNLFLVLHVHKIKLKGPMMEMHTIVIRFYR